VGAWQVTFTPGLDGLAERLAGRKKDAAARKAETVWQAYLRRKAERKAAARARGRHNASSGSEDSGADGGASPPARGGGDADPFFQHEADPFADPFFQARPLKGGPGRSERARTPAAWQLRWTVFFRRWATSAVSPVGRPAHQQSAHSCGNPERPAAPAVISDTSS